MHLGECLMSLLEQSRPASEIILVKDGPVGAALEQVISNFSGRLPLKVVALPKNVGLGNALKAGLEHCSYEIIARMDSDDICVRHRFENQIGFLEAHPDIDAMSGSIQEFVTDPSISVSVRKLPSDHKDIYSYAKHRNPLNHMAVAFRKSSVIAAGNYPDRRGFEDYALWVQMLQHGFHLHNINDLCVFARCGNGMLRRRGGWSYFRREVSLFMYFYSINFLKLYEAIWNITLRMPVRIMPASFRSLIYCHVLRNKLGIKSDKASIK